MHFIIGLFIFSILFNYMLAWSKNRNRFGWVLMGFVLPVASGMVLWALPRREISQQCNDTTSEAPALTGVNNASNRVALIGSKSPEYPRQNDCEAVDFICEENKSNGVEKIPSEEGLQKDLKIGNFSDSNFYIKGSKRPLFLDVETTGLHSNDAIVSIAMFLLYAEESQKNQTFKYASLHYIFDPCKKSHPMAEKIHGYDDWTLRHQELFEEKLPEMLELINECDLIVAHNINFDMRFLRKSFSQAGIDIGSPKTTCTMEMHGGSLVACANSIGLRRKKETHDAAEDAAMCMCLYLASMSNINVSKLYPLLNIPGVSNYISTPPQPAGQLPRRDNVRKRKAILGAHNKI
ncbi:3'-5' exonuclease [Acetobacter indonesiensis]|uniref:3'-5' exonuclease n=1 Tax=Acetobacter indonesiensis TaxID=104101 RepID=UPI001F31A70B|nr:3'-5' exonuclease [Acetobacter indonesiensis]MCG0995312.1 3'-5' exonuclease [Acetobacter indonesiensis]